MNAQGPRSSTGTAPADPGPADGVPDRPVPPLSEAAATRAATARRQRNRRRVVVLTGRVLVLVVFVGLWQLLSSTGTIDTFYFGEPSGVWTQLWAWTAHGTSQGPLWDQVWVTLQETLLGFGIGVTLGVVCGIVLGRLSLLSDVFAPYIKTLNSIPRIVLGSVFAIWFGLGIDSKVALAVVLVFFGVFFNAFQGAREVDRNLIANARILGASNAKVTLHVVIPSALSWITTSLHIAFGFAITGAIVGELLGAQQGLGLLISQAQANFDPDGVYAGLVITAAFALIAEGLITLLERRLLRWRPRPRSSGAGS
ncbi:ABC transporter permease [Streptomyces sp. SL13]|jgi:NitT/TauT family transport system permease protein|uniref:ABC transporter permease n=1 Tax=Streptantibioticus silvisoli TaxID=2705255 RepID=A0AA90JWX9_9ACTN|nr:ABC transporter permease [Streptantibioticus silvisoli]MDI5963696.1 ABC transporter permease [Streptantibioticus silvisoli]MDI5969536.1 ABC transporter permease [Streptantibioticus silvisoli]